MVVTSLSLCDEISCCDLQLLSMMDGWSTVKKLNILWKILSGVFVV